MLALQEMIKKYLFLKDFSTSTPFANPDATSKPHLITDSLLNFSTKR